MNPPQANAAPAPPGGAEPWLKLLLLGSMVLPLVIVAIVAWHDYQETTLRAAERIERTTRIAREHTLKVFDTNDIILRRVFDLLATRDDGELLAEERRLHDRLRAFTRGLPQVRGIWVWDAEGHPVATSVMVPAPRELSIADRSYFQAVQVEPERLVVSDTLDAPEGGETVFVMSRRRDDAEGRFAGAVTIVLSPGYFSRFYGELAGAADGITVALTRPDGAVVTRYPDAPLPGTRNTSHNPLIPLIGDAAPTGVTTAVSPQDGRRRYVMAQRVGDYPLFVTTGLLESAVIGDWLDKLWLPVMVAFGCGFALVLAALVTLERTRRERQAIAQWQEEATRRANAERMLSALSQYLIRLSETEKAKLAAELHDELGGALSALALDVAWVHERLKEKAPELADRQAQAMKLVQETAMLKRRIIDGLRPMLLQHLGLAVALSDYVAQWSRKSGVQVDVRVPQEIRGLAPDAALALFRVVQESLTNVAKYARAARVTVEVAADATGVGVTVADDGVGIAAEALARPTSHGITGMQQRIAAFSGTFRVESQPGRGTRIVAHVPLAVAPPADKVQSPATAAA